MIQRITRNKLNIERYTTCLQQSTNYLIYAEVWYLDGLANDGWDCYVLNDYEAIMPIPYQKKFGLKIISQPLYCQQLGVFHSNEFTSLQFEAFLKKLRKNFVNGYNFNEENTINFQPDGIKCINQIVDKNHYDYSKMVKRNLRKFKNEMIKIEEENLIENYLFFKLKYANHQINIKQFSQVLKNLQENNALKIIAATQDNVVAYGVFIISANRLIYLDAVSSPLGKKLKAATGIIDFALQHLITKNTFLDFEGSSITSIHQFYAQFGSTDAYYTKYSNLPKF